MSKSEPGDSFSDEEFPNFLITILAFAVVAAFLVIGVFVFNFHRSSFSKDPADWGTLGDYIGGFLNPIFGLATVILVVVSITIQRKELRASLKEMVSANEFAKKMSFEQSLFAWLENYHSQIRDIDGAPHKGRKVLAELYKENLSESRTVALGKFALRLGQEELDVSRPDVASEAYVRIWIPQNFEAMCERVLYAVIQYQQLHRELMTELDAPFRTLYRLLRWIDCSERADAEKWHYATLVRSQLSWPELVFLYYNGLTDQGERMAVYSNKYALFDNLLSQDSLIRFAASNLTNVPGSKHPRVRDGSATWPYTSGAFSSKAAKAAMKLPPDA